MKAPSVYPVLDNRPIDQWKVTELKEELKRRKLVTKGLKEELVRRLSESIQMEMEAAEEQVDNGADDHQPDADVEPAQMTQIVDDTQPVANETINGEREKEDDNTQIDTTAPLAEDKPQHENLARGNNQEVLETNTTSERLAASNIPEEAPETNTAPEKLAASNAPKEALETNKTSEDLDASKIPEEALETNTTSEKLAATNIPEEVLETDTTSGKLAAASHIPEEVLETKTASEKSAESNIPEEVLETNTTYVEMDMDSNASRTLCDDTAMTGQGLLVEETVADFNVQQDTKEVRQPHEDAKTDLPDPNYQVSEVSHSLGFREKHDSISSASVSINEKNDLKDNIIADNVKLEHDVMPEMVTPSSSNVATDGGHSHPMDVEEPQEKKVSLEETHNKATSLDMTKKSHSADLGSSEKLNLDRSSGEDSIGEDTLESKQIDSKYAFDEISEKSVKPEGLKVDEEIPVDVVGDDVFGQKDGVAALAEKRKLPGDEAVIKDEPPKRQRRWKSENISNKETSRSNPPPSMIPTNMPPSAAVMRNLSRSGSNVNKDAPEERVVPPAIKPPTDSLKIDNFLRPFTLKAVQELLGKTGNVTRFWMDHIKTHCYITYSSVDEAIATRNAVYNLRWPPNGGKLLVAEFVDAEEVKARLEAPPQPPAAPATAGPGASATVPLPSPRQTSVRQQTTQQPSLPPPPPLSNLSPVRERVLPPPPPPPLADKVEPPIVTLDDLFRKTKATPRIYYLPLSEEQVNAKVSGEQARRRADQANL